LAIRQEQGIPAALGSDWQIRTPPAGFGNPAEAGQSARSRAIRQKQDIPAALGSDWQIRTPAGFNPAGELFRYHISK